MGQSTAICISLFSRLFALEGHDLQCVMDHCEHTKWIYKMSQRKETTLNEVFKGK